VIFAASAGAAFAQCMTSPSAMAESTAIQNQAFLYLNSGRKTAGCKLLERLRNNTQRDLNMYRSCGLGANAVTAEGLLDSITDLMTTAECD
jgi:hypothetical protein